MSAIHPQAALVYRPTPADRKWRWRRLAYYLLHPLFFVIVGFRLAPNLILFHSLFRPGAEAYLSSATALNPVIAEIKAYQRDKGELPESLDELPAAYQPRGVEVPMGEILNYTSITFAAPGRAIAVLEYEFSPEKEGWYLHAPGYDGKLPLPIVPAAPRPTTTPTTTSPVTNTTHAN